MAVNKVDILKFLELAKERPVLDARSPGEFEHAHFPGAINLPLFSNDERKVVGTAYKQKGREEAIKIGLDYFGLKMRKMVEEVEKLIASRPSEKKAQQAAEVLAPEAQPSIWGDDEKIPFSATPVTKDRLPGAATVLVHCWRGGMRSAAVAWLLDLYGFKVYLLEGGYKKFRHYVLETFSISFNCKILGGYTGSGKTAILNELSTSGVAIVDLERLANHKGSAFGRMGPQPSQEMFENELAMKLRECLDHPFAHRGIWLEDESQRIGAVIIPQQLWDQMRQSFICFLDIPFEERLENLVREYGQADKQELCEAILRIQKRLGGLETKNAIKLLMENDTRSSFRILLAYYDKSYLKGFLKRPILNSTKDLTCESVEVKKNVLKLLDLINSKQLSF